MSVFSRLKKIARGQGEFPQEDYYKKSWQAGRRKRKTKGAKSLTPLLSTFLSIFILLLIAYVSLDTSPLSFHTNLVHDSLGKSVSEKQDVVITETGVVKNSLQAEIVTTEESKNLIPVYVSGAVKKPGVYYLKEGSLLLDLLELAGGLNEQAVPHQLNLAAELSSNSHIHFPSRDELLEGWLEERFEHSSVQSGRVVEEANTLIDLNTCTREDLLQVKGIGEVLAEAILDYRESLDRPMHKEDLLQVRGIADKKYSSISAYFR